MKGRRMWNAKWISVALCVWMASASARAQVCDATLGRVDAFVRTELLEVGVGTGFVFGTADGAPTGYHPRRGSDRTLGFVANPERNGWASYDGDFIPSAEPQEEGWGIQLVGSEPLNNNNAGPIQMPGGEMQVTCDALFCPGQPAARITWTGSARLAGHRDSLTIVHEVYVPYGALFAVVDVTFVNTNDRPIDLFYFRTMNPANNAPVHGQLQTRNTVVSQSPPEALVTAEQDPTVHPSMTNPAYVAFVSREPTAVVSFGGTMNRSAVMAHAGTGLQRSGSAVGDESINIAFRVSIPPLGSERLRYVIAFDRSALDDMFRCTDVDSDGDGVVDRLDIDDDDDGVPDMLDVPAFSGGDPGGDVDWDGVVDWRDADQVPGGCVDSAPPVGMCDALAASLDTDGDTKLPDHLDLDADGDGITDTLESGGLDADGDGRPDGCVAHSAVGGCESSSGASLLVTSLPDTDGDGVRDVDDLDSDADTIADNDEAFDLDGDGTRDLPPSGGDGDGNGIDSAYDPSESGAPVVLALAAHRDADLDGIGDWLEVCGDAYVTGAEVCDTGADRTTCSAACLLSGMQPCTNDAECDSMSCDPALRVCVSCIDTGVGVDEGCPSARPICLSASCVACDDTAAGAGVDEGCSASAPECDVRTRTCGPCTDPACLDAGVPDAGVDAGVADAGLLDAGLSDAGLDGGGDWARPVGSGLSCAYAPGRGSSSAWLALLVALALLRRRQKTGST